MFDSFLQRSSSILPTLSFKIVWISFGKRVFSGFRRIHLLHLRHLCVTYVQEGNRTRAEENGYLPLLGTTCFPPARMPCANLRKTLPQTVTETKEFPIPSSILYKHILQVNIVCNKSHVRCTRVHSEVGMNWSSLNLWTMFSTWFVICGIVRPGWPRKSPSFVLKEGQIVDQISLSGKDIFYRILKNQVLAWD